MIPEPIKRFVDAFSRLPGIGVRQATRLAFKIAKLGKGKINEISEAANQLNSLNICENCLFVYEEPISSLKTGLCGICSNPQRNQKVIILLEKETDLVSLEKTKAFNGRYFVLGESSKSGTLDENQRARLQKLIGQIKKIEKAEEIIIALNPGSCGDIVSSFIIEDLRPWTEKITLLGRGLPIGGEIEFADEETLGHAIQNRK